MKLMTSSMDMGRMHQRRQGHQPADGQHHHQHADHRGDGGDELGDALVEALAEGIHIVGHTGEHLAVGAWYSKYFIGRRLIFPEISRRRLIGHLLGHAGHQISPA